MVVFKGDLSHLCVCATFNRMLYPLLPSSYYVQVLQLSLVLRENITRKPGENIFYIDLYSIEEQF